MKCTHCNSEVEQIETDIYKCVNDTCFVNVFQKRPKRLKPEQTDEKDTDKQW